jgi:hypothetical protein
VTGSGHLGRYARAQYQRIERRGHVSGRQRFRARNPWVTGAVWAAITIAIWITLVGPDATWHNHLIPIALLLNAITSPLHDLALRRAITAWDISRVGAESEPVGHHHTNQTGPDDDD